MRYLLVTALILALALAICHVPDSSAQSTQLMVYPAKGQSSEQQKKDEAECHQWAVDQSKYDPTQPQQEQAKQEGKKDRTVLRGAAGGAVVGGVVGSMDGNWGKGAAVGAGIGAAGGAVRRGRQNRKAEQQAQQVQNEKMQAYNKAKSACLEGKGYTVK